MNHESENDEHEKYDNENHAHKNYEIENHENDNHEQENNENALLSVAYTCPQRPPSLYSLR